MDINKRKIELVKLKDLVQMKHGSRPMPLYDKKFFSESGIPYLQVSDFDNSTLVKTSKWKFNKLGERYSYFVPKNSLLMTSGGTIGKVAYNKFDACISDGIIHFYNFKCDEIYFFYLLVSKTNEINLLSNSSTMKRLSSFNLGNMELKISLIDINEQIKIGNFFTIIDKKINYLEIKKKFLKEYKRKTIVIIFENLNNTNKYNFMEIFEKYSEKNINKYPQYTIGKNDLKLIENKNYDISNHIIFKKSDLIIGLGINEINLNNSIKIGCCSPIYNIFKTNSKLLNTNYGKYFISFYLEKNKNLISKKSSRREFEIVVNELRKLEIPLPKIEYQKEVGNFLLNIDKNIELNKSELKYLKEYKEKQLNLVFNILD